MGVCVRACVRARTRVCMCVCVHACTCAYVRACARVCVLLWASSATVACLLGERF